MWTLSEKRWLIYRSNGYCRNWCRRNSMACLLPNKKHCPLCPSKQDLQEAAEFEGRAAVKLAKVIAKLVKENPFSDIEVQAITPDLVLKWAYLKVEEEMDADI